MILDASGTFGQTALRSVPCEGGSHVGEAMQYRMGTFDACVIGADSVSASRSGGTAKI